VADTNSLTGSKPTDKSTLVSVKIEPTQLRFSPLFPPFPLKNPFANPTAPSLPFTASVLPPLSPFVVSLLFLLCSFCSSTSSKTLQQATRFLHTHLCTSFGCGLWDMMVMVVSSVYDKDGIDKEHQGQQR